MWSAENWARVCFDVRSEQREQPEGPEGMTSRQCSFLDFQLQIRNRREVDHSIPMVIIPGGAMDVEPWNCSLALIVLVPSPEHCPSADLPI